MNKNVVAEVKLRRCINIHIYMQYLGLRDVAPASSPHKRRWSGKAGKRGETKLFTPSVHEGILNSTQG